MVTQILGAKPKNVISAITEPQDKNSYLYLFTQVCLTVWYDIVFGVTGVSTVHATLTPVTRSYPH